MFCSFQCMQHDTPPSQRMIGQAVGEVAARRPPSISLLWFLSCLGSQRGSSLFDDFYDLTAARLDNHGQIVHDRIAVTQPHAILAGHRVKRYVSGQHRAESHTARVPDRWTVLAYHVFAKLRPLLDAQDAADGAGGGTDGPTNNRPERFGRSFACGHTLLGSPDRALCVRSIGQRCDEERGNRKQVLVHVRSYFVRLDLAPLHVPMEKTAHDTWRSHEYLA